MATTNFAALTDEALTAWERDVWKAARNASFLQALSGSLNAMVHRVTELKQSDKGARAVMTLVADAQGDGVAGDNQLEGNEEALRSYDRVINIDQLRHAHKHKGEMADQRSVVNFRKEAKDVLGYWLGDRWDQMGFLTLAGVSYNFHTNGAPRVGSQLSDLVFAGDVSAPSDNRYGRFDATSGLIMGSTADNADLIAADTPTYDMLIDLKAYAAEQFIKPVRMEDGSPLYFIFMTPRGMAKLKRDTAFREAVQHAGVRGDKNLLFKGTGHGAAGGIYLDGLYIMEFRHVYNTLGAASGSKWGGGAIDGQRLMLCGAQALGMADIGMPRWKEKSFDYGNQPGISVGKISGLHKPVFRSDVTNTDEDFSVICVDTAI